MNSMKQNQAMIALKHILIPIAVLIAVAALTYSAAKIVLPEKFQAYEAFFLILTAIVSLFFITITVPCGLYGGYLAVAAIVRDKKYVVPVITILLDCAVLFSWVYFLRQFCI